MAGPAYRVVFKSKNGTSAEVATLWPNDFGGFNFSPVTEESDSDYGKKLPLADALKLQAQKKGFINVWSTERRDRDEDEGDDEF